MSDLCYVETVLFCLRFSGGKADLSGKQFVTACFVSVATLFRMI